MVAFLWYIYQPLPSVESLPLIATITVISFSLSPLWFALPTENTASLPEVHLEFEIYASSPLDVLLGAPWSVRQLGNNAAPHVFCSGLSFRSCIPYNMSEDADRAARAARGKAIMMKKKQQQQQKKAISGGPSTSSGIASPATASPPASVRAFSPAPSEPPPPAEEEKRDLSDVFSKGPGDGTDIPWLASLPRSDSIPSRTSTPASHTSPPPRRQQPLVHPVSPPAKTSTAQDDSGKLRSLVEDQQQTISFLVSEKSSLAAQLERLQEMETKLQETATSLEDERKRSKELHDEVQRLGAVSEASATSVNELQAKEKELSERCRDQERELQLTRGEANDLGGQLERFQIRVRELEEQIQNDDRVERLESSLKNVQDRADEQDFQLSRAKQAITMLKAERDGFESQIRTLLDREKTFKGQIADFEAQRSANIEQLFMLTGERDKLQEEKSSLQSELEARQKSLSDLEAKLAQSTSELAAASRQVHAIQSELRAAHRRAEEAEMIQKDLQSEGTGLMRSLEEERLKVAELISSNQELRATLAIFENTVSERDDAIRQFETYVEQQQQQKKELDERVKATEDQGQRQLVSTQESLTELQNAYSALQVELDSARDSLHKVESERASQSQSSARLLEELNNLRASNRTQEQQLASTSRELEDSKRAAEEEKDFLERARSEIESLRRDLSAKDEEIRKLQEATGQEHSHPPGSPSLNEEMLSALRQQHALDLSNAHSRIRALETQTFQAEAKAHTLQKQVVALEDQLGQQRTLSRGSPRPFSPGASSSRPGSRAFNRTDEPRRSLQGSHRPSNLVSPPLRPPVDENLSPEMRHKRKVSLSMLKARIDSERAVTAAAAVPGRERAGLPTVKEPAPANLAHVHRRRPQFLDDSHVFWCSSCQGDLVIL